MNKNRGITLIALIVTIIILLILSGITIGALGGENGLIARAKQAREETQKAQATDAINLKITNIQISSWAEKEQMPTLQYLADKFYEDDEIETLREGKQKTASKTQLNTSKLESIFVKLYEYPYEFEINENLQLASIDGVEIQKEVADNSEDINEMKTMIQQLQTRVTDLETSKAQVEQELNDAKSKLATSESEISTIKSTYATKQYVDDLPQNLANYTDLTWTLLDTTTSSSWVKSSANIDQYNYIAIAMMWANNNTVVNPCVISVGAFKSLFKTSTESFISSDGNGSNVRACAYYNNGLYIKSESGIRCAVYGIK